MSDADRQPMSSEFVSVKDFGAVGDGVTDDTDAIQAAFDEAYCRGVGVRFPLPDPGDSSDWPLSSVYYMSRPIVVRGRLARAVQRLKRALRRVPESEEPARA